VAERKDVRPFAQELLHEVFAVARQSGITVGKVQGFSIQKLFDYRGSIKKALSYALLPLAMKNHRDLYSGMLFDLKKGRSCDIDFICGAVIDQAKECHVATPLHERVLALVHEIERGQRQIGEQNISALSL
jgi:2-dehydropantoate 2-reductase